MIVFPNCKINLGLRVIRKRNDGYHDLETFFYPLPFYDVLELVPSSQPAYSFTTSGLTIEGNTASNLCIKAYELIKKDFPSLPPVQIHLHKTIPTGAGLGGGSADAAFMLQLLNRKFNLGLSNEQLSGYALQTGSDSPFFLLNKPCFATSRGEVLTPVQLDLSAWQFILVKPAVSVRTGEAFSGIMPSVPGKSIRQIIEQPVETWKNELINDFEGPVFKQHPSIKEIREELYRQGAVYASLSGSGSTVYGLFSTDQRVEISFPSGYLVKRLSGQL